MAECKAKDHEENRGGQESAKTQTAIIKADGRDEYYFYDDPVWGEDLDEENVVGVAYTEDAAGTHECDRSCLYDDMTGFVDKLQGERDLHDWERYIVAYFKQDTGMGLLQLVDFGITKSEIIANVKAQKYLEGARYYTMGQLQPAIP